MIIIVDEYDLIKVEKEFFVKRFVKENLDKKDGEMFFFVMENDN